MDIPVTRIDRRDFLTKVGLGAAVSPLLWNAQRARSRPAFRESPTLAKQPLTQDDFEYAGVLRVPVRVRR